MTCPCSDLQKQAGRDAAHSRTRWHPPLQTKTDREGRRPTPAQEGIRHFKQKQAGRDAVHSRTRGHPPLQTKTGREGRRPLPHKRASATSNKNRQGGTPSTPAQDGIRHFKQKHAGRDAVHSRTRGHPPLQTKTGREGRRPLPHKRASATSTTHCPMMVCYEGFLRPALSLLYSSLYLFQETEGYTSARKVQKPARPPCLPFSFPFLNNLNPYPPVSVIGYLPSRYRHFRVLTSIPTPIPTLSAFLLRHSRGSSRHNIFA